MDISLKRIGAYIIDVVIVFLVTSVLINTKFINPRIDNYTKHYEEYTKLMEDYDQEKITDDIFKEKITELNYDLANDSLISSGITIGIYLAYFAFFQYFNNGQTIGKKIFKLQTVSNNAKKLNIGHYLLRSLILNNIIFQILLIIGIFVFSKTFYYDYSSVVSFIESLVETIILIMVILRKDNRGLHDIIAGTKVVDLNPSKNSLSKEDEVKELTVEKKEKIKKKEKLKE